MKFNKKKWQNFQRLITRFRRKSFYDPISYFIFNFKNFFSKKFNYNLQNKQRLSFFYGKLRKSYLKNLVKSTLKEFKSSCMYDAYTYPETRLVSYYILKSTNLKVKKWTNVIRCAMEKASFISAAMDNFSTSYWFLPATAIIGASNNLAGSERNKEIRLLLHAVIVGCWIGILNLC